MPARIYKPPRNASQSGQANIRGWVLEYETEDPRKIEPLMGWTTSRDTRTQVKLTFETVEQAKAYAERSGIPYHVIPPTTRKLRLQSYADNFK